MRRLAVLLFAASLVMSACDRRPEATPVSEPDATTGDTSAPAPSNPPASTAPATGAAPSLPAPGADLGAFAETVCGSLATDRYATQARVFEEARSSAGAGVNAAVEEACSDRLAAFEALEQFASRSATVNRLVTTTVGCGTEVTIRIRNDNGFTVDTGILVQVGSFELGPTGGTVVLGLGIGPGETRELVVDPVEEGTDVGAETCGVESTAWEAATGATATIFGPDEPIVDPGGRDLPQTRTDDPSAFLPELVEFEVALLAAPDGDLIEEFEDVRSPNFLRLISEFDERVESGTRVEMDGSEISNIRVVAQPRDDLVLVGWTSAPGTITSFDTDGNVTGEGRFGSRERRGIFLRSPVDGRWRWVHSAFTIIEEGGPPENDDAVTA